MTVTERITALRKQMKEKGIDAYLVPTDENTSPDLPVLPELP